MAKFKNKNIGTDRKEKDFTGIEDDQLKKINKHVKMTKYRDLLFSILFVIFVVYIISALIYAAITLVRGYTL